jgi:hypothetical protein
MNTFTLTNDSLRLTFDRESGALVGLVAVESGWNVLDRPHLGLSFRLLVPLPGRRNNPVPGEGQRLTFLDVDEGGRCATLTWDGATSLHGGDLDVRVTLEVRMTDRQAIFGATVENRSPHVVENVYSPYLGDVRPPPGETWFRLFRYGYAGAREHAIWPTFENTHGYYGVDHPTLQPSTWVCECTPPQAPFVLLRGARQGLYAGVHEPRFDVVAWQAELRPGYASCIDGRVPEGESASGKDVATRFAAVHLPYVLPGEMRALTPIAVEPFRGDWHAGVEVYKSWRDGWMQRPPLPAWVKEPHSWQQIHVNSPEDELRLPYCDLVQVGEECARHGVKAIQLTGWTLGGQDRDNPSHDPDPRLGTADELKEAIARVQALGVKVVLFAKFIWADRATERFRRELERLAIKDPHGDYYLYHGYRYQTATQLLDVNTRRLVPMCFLSEEWLELCELEFRKMLDLGADGILHDECCHHTPALLCFDPNHGHRIGAPVYANDVELARRFGRLAREAGIEFLFAGEACYDWMFQAYHLSYHRSKSKHHVPLSRYLLPDALLMTAVTGFDDRNMVNQCLLYRYVISYEPYNFKGRLDDYPLTMAYGRQMDALRAELRGFFWDGEFRDTIGATVTVGGEPHHPYTVFRRRGDGKQGVAIANYDDVRPITALVALDDAQPPGRYRLVDDAKWRAAKDGIAIPPRSAAVVIE